MYIYADRNLNIKKCMDWEHDYHGCIPFLHSSILLRFTSTKNHSTMYISKYVCNSRAVSLVVFLWFHRYNFPENLVDSWCGGSGSWYRYAYIYSVEKQIGVNQLSEKIWFTGYGLLPPSLVFSSLAFHSFLTTGTSYYNLYYVHFQCAHF